MSDISELVQHVRQTTKSERCHQAQFIHYNIGEDREIRKS